MAETRAVKKGAQTAAHSVASLVSQMADQMEVRKADRMDVLWAARRVVTKEYWKVEWTVDLKAGSRALQMVDRTEQQTVGQKAGN